LRALFTLVIPMLLVSNVPVKALLDHVLSLQEIALMLGVCVAALLFSGFLWRVALTRYTSASS
jgi:ABC-type uncharacterized transport system permease subunit